MGCMNNLRLLRKFYKTRTSLLFCQLRLSFLGLFEIICHSRDYPFKRLPFKDLQITCGQGRLIGSCEIIISLLSVAASLG